MMLLPGKVPSYYDYFPGDAYEAYLENPDYGYTDQQVTIPPRIMENMFALADIVPGRYPLRGAESGESMAILYEDILNKMEVKGFNQKTLEEKERYVTAINYLAEDPLNVTMNVTRFQMYRRSQELYNQRKLDMENIIEEMRTTLPGIEYERWFQRNYPTMWREPTPNGLFLDRKRSLNSTRATSMWNPLALTWRRQEWHCGHLDSPHLIGLGPSTQSPLSLATGTATSPT